MKEKDLEVKVCDLYGESCLDDACNSREESGGRKPQGFVEIYEVDESGDRKLIGKVVLITCATLKIEKDIAKSFVKQGATLMLISKNKELLEKNTRELGVYNDFDVHFEMADIQNDIDVKNIINKTIKKLGKIDILVNNAGIFRDLNTLNEISKFESDKIMDVNFWIE